MQAEVQLFVLRTAISSQRVNVELAVKTLSFIHRKTIHSFSYQSLNHTHQLKGMLEKAEDVSGAS